MKKLLTGIGVGVTATLAAIVILAGYGTAGATWQPCEEVEVDYLAETYKPPPCPTTTTSTTTTTTTVPETTVPDTTVPETTVPETTAPATTTPTTTVAVVVVPSTQAPSTTAPAPAPQSLPATGSENWSIAAAATLFLLLGGSVLLIARRTD